MGIVLTNWKTAVSGIRRVWISVPMMTVFISFSSGPVKGLLWGFLALFGLVGFELTVKWGEVGTKPFSFLLPGYRQSLRALYFSSTALTGLVVSLALVWVLREWGDSSYPAGPNLAQLSLNALVGFLTGMTLLLVPGAGDFAVLFRKRGVAIFSSLSLIFFVLFVLMVAREHVFVRCGIILPVLLILCGLLWIRLGDMRYVRQGHRQVLGGLTEPLVPKETRQETLPRAQDFFLRRMEGYEPFSPGRSCWGGLYRSFAPALLYWQVEVLVLVAYALLVSLTGGVLGIGLVYMGLIAWCVHLPLISDPAPLLPAGRKQRCLATGVTALVVSSLFVALGLAVIALSWSFRLSLSLVVGEYIRPEVAMPIDAARFYCPCLLVPWVIALRLFTGRAAEYVRAAIVCALVFLLIAVGWWPYHTVSAWKVHMVFAGVLLSGWTFLLVTLWANCRAHDSMSIR